MKPTFPWTTVVVAICLVASIVILIVTHNTGNEAFPILVSLLVPTLGAMAYSENTNRNVKNGLIVKKVQQGLNAVGLTPESMAQTQQITQTAMDTLSTHTTALATVTTALSELLSHILPNNNGTGDGQVHG